MEAAHARASETLERIFPEEWKESSDEADYDLVEISLDQLEAAVSAGERGQAEQARLSAYAFFEFGPELKLRAFDPGLVAEIEGLVWYGAGGNAGLAQLIADGAPIAEVRETRIALEEELDTARAKTGEGASDGTVITNSALIVFREGLEAILIIAAITASLIGPAATCAAPSSAAPCWRSRPASPSGSPPCCCSTRSPDTARSWRPWSGWSRSGCCW